MRLSPVTETLTVTVSRSFSNNYVQRSRRQKRSELGLNCSSDVLLMWLFVRIFTRLFWFSCFQHRSLLQMCRRCRLFHLIPHVSPSSPLYYAEMLLFSLRLLFICLSRWISCQDGEIYSSHLSHSSFICSFLLRAAALLFKALQVSCFHCCFVLLRPTSPHCRCLSYLVTLKKLLCVKLFLPVELLTLI